METPKVGKRVDSLQAPEPAVDAGVSLVPGDGASRGEVIPITLKQAQAFVVAHHRHHGRVAGAKFSLGWSTGGTLRAVLIAGRPVARGLQDGRTVEITRLASDGCPNACSALYGAAWRAARAMGYLRAVTYTLATERGASLRAAGWKVSGTVRGRSWSCRSRPRIDSGPIVDKVRWLVTADRRVTPWQLYETPVHRCGVTTYDAQGRSTNVPAGNNRT